MNRRYIFLGVVILALWGVVLVQVLKGSGEDNNVSTNLNVYPSLTVKPSFVSSSQPSAAIVSVPRAAGSSLIRHNGVSSSASPEFGTLYQGTAPSSGHRLDTSSSRSVSLTSSTSTFVSASLAMATPPLAYQSSVSLAARSVKGGMTSEQTYANISPRRAIINDGDDEDYGDDDDLRPQDPNDPFHTPVGDIPVLLMLALAVFYIAGKILLKKSISLSCPIASIKGTVRNSL